MLNAKQHTQNMFQLPINGSKCFIMYLKGLYTISRLLNPIRLYVYYIKMSFKDVQVWGLCALQHMSGFLEINHAFNPVIRELSWKKKIL